jgi:outer membrane lipoprotein SlyB
MFRRVRFVLIGLLACGLWACATLPAGPSVMVLPGTGKSFDAFQADDAACRDWAFQRIGVSPSQHANQTAATGAAVGTAVGAAAGAAIGAASGNPGAGAAIGAGSGLLVGSAAGLSEGQSSGLSLQERYDIAFMQCMYAKGNQIPVARSAAQNYASSSHPPQPTSHSRNRKNVPPPPPGAPPPPPPGVD